MNNLLSAQEVADILKIARNTVYELIKRGELNSSKVGKQVRVSKEEVESFLARNKSTETTSLKSQQVNKTSVNNNGMNQQYVQSYGESTAENKFIICGQDISLDILVNHLSALSDSLQLYRSYIGSYNGIYALYNGSVNVATAHLWDGDTNEYNLPYVKKMMPGVPAFIIRIGTRKQGFYVQKGNPKGLTGWTDLSRKDILIVNREKGSGSRVLLDERLRLMGIKGENIDGYFRECKSHLAAANAVSRGGADVAVGSEMFGRNILGIDFIPLQDESYDLVIRLADADKQPYKAMIEIITSHTFKMDLDSVGGYDTTETGKIILC